MWTLLIRMCGTIDHVYTYDEYLVLLAKSSMTTLVVACCQVMLQMALLSLASDGTAEATSCNTLIFKKIKTCQANAFHLNSNMKILNNLIGCISWHAYLFFLSPSSISLFKKI
jgi:hypothetical protein